MQKSNKQLKRRNKSDKITLKEKFYHFEESKSFNNLTGELFEEDKRKGNTKRLNNQLFELEKQNKDKLNFNINDDLMSSNERIPF